MKCFTTRQTPSSEKPPSEMRQRILCKALHNIYLEITTEQEMKALATLEDEKNQNVSAKWNPDKLEALKSAQQQVQQQFERGEITKDQYDALQREIIETEQNLKDLEKQAKDTNTSLSGFTQAAEKIGKFGDAATSAGQKMLPVTAAITAAGGASAKMAMDFEN